MKAEEYLGQARVLSEEIDRKLDEIRMWRATAQSISSSGFDEHFNASRSTEAPYVRIIEKINIKEKEADELVERLVDLKNEMAERFAQLKDIREEKILRMRYCEFYKWNEIAEHLHISLSLAYKIHQKALINFKKNFENF